MAFHVGQKVVCVDASGLVDAAPDLRLPTEGTVYTVREIVRPHETHSRLLCLRFEELRNPIRCYSEGPLEGAFPAHRFRPLIERKKQTDISVFKEILDRETFDDKAPVSDHQRERRTEPQRSAKRVVP